jgi:hypothetical protein
MVEVASQILYVDALLNLASGAVALLISYYAFRFNRLLENNVLRFVSFGFMMLGIGLLVEALTRIFVTATLKTIVSPNLLLTLASGIYLFLQVAAYFVFAWGYALGAYTQTRVSGALLLGGLAKYQKLRRYYLAGFMVNLVAQLLSVIFLAFVVFQGVLVYSRSHNRLSLMVLLGFTLIFAAHLVMLASILVVSGLLLAVGSVIRFAGFASMLVFLIRSGRVGAARETS